jgi:hypothetical protein
MEDRPPMSLRYLAFIAWLACLAAAGAACRNGGGDGDADADSDADGDGDADADDDFDAALCDQPFPLGGDCDPTGQHCCGGGERCTLIPDGAADGGLRESCGEAGDGRHGSPCAELGDESCSAGTWCYAHPMVSFCAKFCATGGDCPTDPMTTCGTITELGTEYHVCTPAYTDCDALAGTGCPADYACVLQMLERSVLVECVPVGTHAANEDCSDGAGCAEGSGCYVFEDGSQWCLGYCTLEETCADGQACVDIGHYALGVCLPPVDG